MFQRYNAYQRCVPIHHEDLLHKEVLPGVSGVRVAACKAHQQFPEQVEFEVCDRIASQGNVMASAAVETFLTTLPLTERRTATEQAEAVQCQWSLSELYQDDAISKLWVFSTKPWVTMPAKAPRTQSAACKRKSELQGSRTCKVLGLLNWWLPKAIKTRYERAWPAFCAYDQLQTEHLRVGMGKGEAGVHFSQNGVSLLAATWDNQQKLFRGTEFAKPPFVVLVAPAQHLFTYGDVTFMNCSHTDLH